MKMIDIGQVYINATDAYSDMYPESIILLMDWIEAESAVIRESKTVVIDNSPYMLNSIISSWEAGIVRVNDIHPLQLPTDAIDWELVMLSLHVEYNASFNFDGVFTVFLAAARRFRFANIGADRRHCNQAVSYLYSQLVLRASAKDILGHQPRYAKTVLLNNPG